MFPKRFLSPLLIVLLMALPAPTRAAINAQLLQQIEDAASRALLDPKLVQALVKVESNFVAKATSSKGAMGLAQVTAGTAEECEIHNPYHAVSNLMGACDCLRKLINRYRGNLKKALAAYNAGPGAVDKYRGIPPYRETREYVQKVLTAYHKLKLKK